MTERCNFCQALIADMDQHCCAEWLASIRKRFAEIDVLEELCMEWAKVQAQERALARRGRPITDALPSSR